MHFVPLISKLSKNINGKDILMKDIRNETISYSGKSTNSKKTASSLDAGLVNGC